MENESETKSIQVLIKQYQILRNIVNYPNFFTNEFVVTFETEILTFMVVVSWAFIDPTIVPSMFMLLFIFIIVWGTYDIGNPDPVLGQTQKCGRVKLFNGIPTILSW
jgi:hypothetical protein